MSVYRLVCLAGVLLVLAGCKKTEAKKQLAPGEFAPSAVILNVDGVALTFGEMDRYASALHTNALQREGIYYAPNMQREATLAFRRKAINEFVYKTVMLNEATRQNITVNEKEHALALQNLARTLAKNHSNTNDYFNKGPQPPDLMRRDFHDSLVIDKLLNQEIQRKIKVMDDDVEKGVDAIGMSNAVKRVTLEAARKQILEGAAFEDVARTISQDLSTMRQGGVMQEFARGKFGEAFDDAVFSLSPGEVSEVVETKYGYHIFKLLARNPAQAAKDGVPAIPETVRAAHILIKPQAADRKQIATAVYLAKFAEGKQAFYDELRAKAKIENVLFPDMQYRALGSAK